MNTIEHVVEPPRLWLVWRTDAPGIEHTRRIVGEIVWQADKESAQLRYLNGTEDFKKAEDEGFEGYPAFPTSSVVHNKGVLDAFLRRLPPRNREDFADYLRRHRLPEGVSYSDMALLGYTGAKLPGDTFELYFDLENAIPPFEIVMEIAGFRHQNNIKADDLYVGDPVNVKREADNRHDSKAIAVYLRGSKIGYVSRPMTSAFHNWARHGYNISAQIERINGKPERPLVYVHIVVR